MATFKVPLGPLSAAATICALGILAMIVLSVTPGSSVKVHQSDCVTADEAYAALSHVNGMERSVDSVTTEPPFQGMRSTYSFVTDFEQARIVGYLNKVARESQYVESSNDLRESLGYEVKEEGFLPLSGQVIADNPGLLEAYQTDYAFSSVEGARDWIESQRLSNSDALVPPGDKLRYLGEDVVLWHRPASKDTQETTFGLSFRTGSDVIGLSLQGGRTVDLDLVTAVAFDVAKQVANSCDAGDSQGDGNAR